MIAQRRVGVGEPLVLLHALGTDRHMWDPVIDRLAAERDVIALDMPGFGASPTIAELARRGLAASERPASPADLAGVDHARLAALAAGGAVSPADLAAAIHSHLVALGLDRPHVAGNSLGGWVALELALAGRARSVTAIAPAGLWAQPLSPKRSAARRLARALRPALPALLKSGRGRRIALGGTIAHPERIPYAAALALVRAYADAPGFDAANAGMRAGRFTGLAEIDVPLTLAWPEHDRLVARPSTVPAVAREFRLRGCGHMPTWDDPEQVARVLLAGSALAPCDIELAAEQDRDAR
ncbi:alpha/beta fold hydrolase [Solirubrobacter ginsenosidimutans]|uniref:Alpha/beta fold hydrolase n=1 Tax=Solirubrobacter ginsenosidimutans TaxID=490573 RepID=A0A9X3RZ00_9ACTN|nr:alpha/beta fold hydrolase [Solirubrobacter ginsenosidimutans]MDA0159689.1 alpha/beta fold hydrolase [Solirubrobacter ginsenosidimutans]